MEYTSDLYFIYVYRLQLHCDARLTISLAVKKATASAFSTAKNVELLRLYPIQKSYKVSPRPQIFSVMSHKLLLLLFEIVLENV